MAHSSASPSSDSEDIYQSEIITGAHGDEYQRDLALVIFVRATRKGYDFKLGYEMTIADKFDDVAFFDRTKKEWILIQAKHADILKGKHTALKFETLFPLDDATREKGDFSLFKYLKSYMTVQASIKERKAFFIFTNKDMTDSLGELVEVETRQVDHISLSDHGRHIGLKVKDSLIKAMLDYVNRDFNSLMDDILKLCSGGDMTQRIKDYKTPLASLLTRTATTVKFSITDSSQPNPLLTALSELIDIKEVKIPLGKCKDLFSGRSRNKRLPLVASEDTVRQFFQDLTLSVRQPNELRSIIDQDMWTWMRTWIQPDSFMHFEDLLLKTSTNSLVKFFNDKQSLVKNGYKPFLYLSDGLKFFSSEEASLNKQLLSSSNSRSISSSKFYITRKIEYSALPSEVLNNENKSVDDTAGGVRMIMQDTEFFSELSEKFRNQRILILAAEPGMGKTTFLRFLALDAQKNSSDKVFFYHLNTFNNKLEQLEDSDIPDKVLSILGAELSESNHKKLQETVISKDKATKYLIIFDAFDEVFPQNREKLVKLFNLLLEAPNVKILVSTRSNVNTPEKGIFESKTISLVPFKVEDQTNFLKQFWNVPAENENLFREYVAHVFKFLYSDINHAFLKFTSVPLMLQMLAEIHALPFKTYLDSNQNKLDELIPQKMISTANLYEQFIYKCFFNEIIKQIGSKPNQDIEEQYKTMLEEFVLKHQLLAIKYLRIEFSQIILGDEKHIETFERFERRIQNGSERSPLVEADDKDCRFIHQSYAEFLVAKFLLSNIEKYETEIFGANSEATLFYDHPMIRMLFLAMIEKNPITQHLEILARHNKKNSDIATWACECFSEVTVNFLLQTIMNPLEKNHLLGVAAEHDMLNVCINLIDNHNVKVNCKTNERNLSTPLHTAAEFGNLEIVEQLIERSADINVKGNYNSTPLHYAAQNGHSNVVNFLIGHPAIVNEQNKYGMTALDYAAKNGHSEVVKILIDRFGIVNAEEKSWAPIHYAAQYGRTEVIRILIDHSANVNAKGVHSSTPLHYAAANGHSEVVALLLEQPGIVNEKNEYYLTPLEYAAQYDHPEIVRILVDHLGLGNSGPNEWTPLNHAASKGHSKVVQVLIERSADVNAKGPNDSTSLHFAAQEGHAEVAKILVGQSGIKVNERNIYGMTALHYATQHGHSEVVTILAKHFGDVNAKDNDDWTPLHYAAQKGYCEIIRTLLDHSADVNARANYDQTALSLAEQNGHFEAAEILSRL